MYYQNFANPNPYMGQVQYGGPVPQMPKAKYTQPLTPEMINKLRSSGDSLDIKVSQDDLMRAICTHKENGAPTLVSEGINPETGNEILRCTICGESFEMVEATEEEVQNAVNVILNFLQTSKTMYLDAPKSLVEQYYQMIPLLKLMPRVYTRAMKNFSMYENALSAPFGNTVAGTNGFQMMGAMLSNPYAAYGYQAPMANPMMGQQPWGIPQQPVAPQQPMMGQQPWGMPQQPMGQNPLMYQAPAAAPAPQMAPSVPVAPAAPAEGTEVSQQKQFNV